MAEYRYLAMGDSFTEGMGDPRSDGSLRGWADLVAEALAINHGHSQYANLAIRGRLLHQIVDEQLPVALALKPSLVTFNGGGNDMLRPGTDLDALVTLFTATITSLVESGARLILVSGGNPMRHLPGRTSVEHKGKVLTAAVRELSERLQLPFADNWNDEELASFQYWSKDRLHLNAHGHTRAASRVLRTMGESVPAHWKTEVPTIPAPGLLPNALFAGKYIAPWLGRRLLRRSSGDGRVAKQSVWVDAPREHANPGELLP